VILAVGAVVVHGYHPGVEDAEIYLPGIKKAIDPALYPHNAAFFASHAHLTLFPNLIAASARLSHVQLDWLLLGWHLFSIFLLLLGCWHIGRIAFNDDLGAWGGVALVASLLTIPVAGTALYVMDEYLTTRSFSTPAVLFIVANIAERKFGRALAWSAFTAVIHPLMVVFGICYAALLLLSEGRTTLPTDRRQAAFTGVAVLLPLGLFPPVTDAYREVLNSRPYFFLLRWQWYEWLGIFAPLALLWWFRDIGRKQKLPSLEKMSSALAIFGVVFFVIGLAVTIPVRFANFAELQPMRSLHLVYILLFVLGGGLLARSVLGHHAWRWALLFVPLCSGMFYVQRQLFPNTPHLELPGRPVSNDWVKGFLWVRQNTPRDAYFALDPEHMAIPGQDQHGFRAIAERSMLADRVKDSGAVTMFPALAQTWQTQVRAQEGWKTFRLADFRRLRQIFGVDWVVVQQPGVEGLLCPYSNSTLQVCRIE